MQAVPPESLGGAGCWEPALLSLAEVQPKQRLSRSPRGLRVQPELRAMEPNTDKCGLADQELQDWSLFFSWLLSSVGNCTLDLVHPVW